MKKMILIATILVSMTGCTKYVKPGASEAELKRDQDECEYQAMLHGGVLGGGYTTAMDIGYRRATIIQHCMGKKGYTLVSK
jgi:hypothetical protein